MIYFSELQGKKVQTEDGIVIGQLDDLVFLALETPQITKIVVKNKALDDLLIPLEFVKKINQISTSPIIYIRNTNILKT